MLKEDVLKLLAAHRLESLSGQALAAQLGVSRNAVWKAVKQLEAEGYRINAGTNKGYRLEGNALTPYDLQLPPQVRPFYYPTIDSTNTEAKRLLAGGLSDEAFLYADTQTAGRGRQGKSFFSPAGTGLYYSYVFHPQKALADAVFITTAAAVSVVRAIEKTTLLRPSIKWVNDVFIGDRKICGILTAAVTDFESGTVESVIVGIGINVTTRDFPPEIARTAAGMAVQDVSRSSLLQALAEELISVAADLRNPAILEDYRAHSLVLGKEITFLQNGVSKRGKAVEIDESGALLVETQSGTERLSSGEISVKF